MFSWKMKFRNRCPIGLDIGHSAVKMIQLANDDGRISVVAADKVHFDPGINDDLSAKSSFVVSAIKKMLHENDFRGRNVVSCLPSGQLKITSLRLVCAKNEDINDVLRKEVEQRFALDFDRDVIDYIFAGSIKQGEQIKNEIILFAAEEQFLKDHLQILEETNLVPVAIDTIACALFRSSERSFKRQVDREKTSVFVDVGRYFTTVVFGKNGQISFVKQIPIGGENFNTEIATKLGVDINEVPVLRNKLKMERVLSSDTKESDMASDEDAEKNIVFKTSTRQILIDAVGSVAEKLAKEISLCFRYYTVTFRGKRIERAIFTGGEAYEQILMDILKEQLTVDVEVAEPLRGMDMTDVNFDSDKRSSLCEWAVATGLSLRGYDAGNDEAEIESMAYERN